MILVLSFKYHKIEFLNESNFPLTGYGGSDFSVYSLFLVSMCIYSCFDHN